MSAHRFRNWGRTVDVTTRGLERPRSEAEVVQLVRRAREEKTRLKVVGAGHSWSDIAATDGFQVSLDALCRVVAVDANRPEITVEAGIRLKHLNEELASRNLALPVLGSVAEQSIAGAISTGTHGSAPKEGSLASLVTRLRLVLGTGEVRELTAADGELFDAARVGLGALGVVTQVTLRCVPAFNLEELSDPVPIDEAVKLLPELAREERFAKVWWLPHTNWAQVSRYRPTEKKLTFSRFARWFDERVVNGVVFALLLAFGRLVPFLIPRLNKLVGVAYFRPVRKVSRSDLAFTVSMPPVHREMEYALPQERAGEALAWLVQLIRAEMIPVNFVVEVRFVAADAPLLSPAFGRDTVYLGAYMAKGKGLERYFEAFERQMLALGGRPHWGKEFSATAEELAAAHPNLARFEQLIAKCDPDGVFANDFLARVFPRARARADERAPAMAEGR